MNKRIDRRLETVAYIILTIMVFLCIIPFLLLIGSSFTDNTTVIKHGYNFWPQKFSLSAYQFIFSNGTYVLHAYGITIFITAVGTCACLLITSMVAYPLSRKDMPLRNFLSFMVFLTLLFNGGLVPTYIVYTTLFHIKDTIAALIIPNLLMNGFNVLLMRTFFQNNIPAAVIESASIDGAGEFRIFISIVLPLSLPILATIGLFSGLAYWNDWYNGLIYITNPNLMSLQNVLNHILLNVQFLQSQATNTELTQSTLPGETVRMAIAVVGVVPVLVLYPFFQKYFAKGLTVGSVKG